MRYYPRRRLRQPFHWQMAFGVHALIFRIPVMMPAAWKCLDDRDEGNEKIAKGSGVEEVTFIAVPTADCQWDKGSMGYCAVRPMLPTQTVP